MTASTLAVGLADVEAAVEVLRGHIERTPFLHSRTLSAIAGAELWLKFENLQYTGSFKERGALNRLTRLTAAERRRGVVAMSAGNHGQGLAWHAARLGIPATIVMPLATPFVKIENTRRLGAEVVLDGAGVDEAAARAQALVAERGLLFVPPFDDPAIIAGQGTTALEMLADRPDLDCMLVPVGGGGLIGGMAVATRAIAPRVEVIGVEAALYPSVVRRRRGEGPPAGGPTIADGIAVKSPGRLTLPIIEALVDDVVTVAEPDIEAAVLKLLEIEKSVVEGAGAVGLAAVLAEPTRFAGRRVGIVLSGGNIDMRLLSAVILRGLARSARLVRLRVTVPDSPGSLARITALVAEAGGNIVDVIHQRAFSRRSAREVEVDLTVETRNGAHAFEVAARLEAASYAVLTLPATGEA